MFLSAISAVIVKLFLVHHGDAVGPDLDPRRPLSERGRGHVVRLAAEAEARGARPAVVWHSGKLRARQTAEAFWRACNALAPLSATRDLQPDDPPEWIRDRLRGLAGQQNLETSVGTLHMELHGIKISLLHYPYPLLFPTRKFQNLAVADPRDIAPTAGVAFSINHIAAVLIPAAFGLLWLVSPGAVFRAGAAMAALSSPLTKSALDTSGLV